MAALYLQSNSSYLMEMRRADEASKCFSCLTHNYNQTQIRIILLNPFLNKISHHLSGLNQLDHSLLVQWLL